MKLTFREAYDRIVDAYLKDELKPWKSCGCFIGNLLGKTGKWENCRTTAARLGYDQDLIKESTDFVNSFGYTEVQITEMEVIFLSAIYDVDFNKTLTETMEKKGNNIYRACVVNEDRLFAAMSSTLDMLKKIHEENGEIVDPPIFQKRTLKTA